MWKNKYDRTWFFFKENRFHNIGQSGTCNCDTEIRKEWETKGNSLRIAPDILGQWNND